LRLISAYAIDGGFTPSVFARFALIFLAPPLKSEDCFWSSFDVTKLIGLG
jgi:hypothetical protein